AHGDKVDPDRVVAAGFDGNSELGADAVIGGDEDRVGEAGGLQVEQPAEAADLGVGAGPARRAHHRLDLLDQRVAGVYVDPGCPVCEAATCLAHAALRTLPSSRAALRTKTGRLQGLPARRSWT